MAMDVRSAAAPTHHVDALTGLRFVAAFMVLLGHGYPVMRFEDNTILGTLLGPMAGVAMSLFFVLSGVVMWLNYAQAFRCRPLGPTLWSFGVARFARLYPLLLVVVLVGFVTAPRGGFGGALPEALLFLTGLQAWVPGSGATPLMMAVPSLAHTWSISAEFFLYLTFPLVVLALRPGWSSGTILAALATTLLVLAAMLWVITIDRTMETLAPGMTALEAREWFYQYSPYVRLPEFVAGCLVAMLAALPRRANGPSSGWARLLLPAALVLAISAVYGRHAISSHSMPLWSRSLVVLAICVLIHEVMRHDSWMRRALSGRFLLWGRTQLFHLPPAPDAADAFRRDTGAGADL